MSDPVPPTSPDAPTAGLTPAGTRAPETPSDHAVPGPARSPTSGAWRGLVRQRRFLVAAGLLLVCAVGFNATAQALQLHFRKQRLELRVPALDDKSAGLPATLGGKGTPGGTWVQVSEDRPMSGDLEKALGTTQYLNRIYVNAKATRSTPEELRKMAPDRVKQVMEELSRQPEAVMQLHMAYYSGLVDTVAHVPDRCMVADGYRPTDPAVVDFTVPAAAGGSAQSLQYRFITFEDTTAQARVTRNVGYLFHVNGEYTPSPLDVRKRLQKLTERFGYYAKVELMTQQTGKADGEAADRSRKAMNDFLAVVLPEVERCLPDWAAATGERPAAPAPVAAAK